MSTFHSLRHCRTGYLVTHQTSGSMRIKRFTRKGDATDYAYSVVNQRPGSSSTVEPANGSRRFRWGDAGLVAYVTFSWSASGEIVTEVAH